MLTTQAVKEWSVANVANNVINVAKNIENDSYGVKFGTKNGKNDNYGIRSGTKNNDIKKNNLKHFMKKRKSFNEYNYNAGKDLEKNCLSLWITVTVTEIVLNDGNHEGNYEGNIDAIIE